MTAATPDKEWFQKAVARSPKELVTVEVGKQEVRLGDRVIKATMPDRPGNQHVARTWNSTDLLLGAGSGIEATAKRLQYAVGPPIETREAPQAPLRA